MVKKEVPTERKSSATRVVPINQSMGKDPLVTKGLERKSSATRIVHPDDLSKEKKPKLKEETKALSVLLATH